VNLLLEETRFNRVVDYTGPLCGRPSGHVKIGDMRALVTQGPALIEPREGKWPHLEASFRGLLGGFEEPHKDHQLNSFYSWLQVAVRSIREYKITQAPALAVAGPAGCGKSVLLQVIVAALGGRQAQPLPYMNGETQFNSDLFNAECLIFDDDGISDAKSDRHKLGQELKKMTVATLQARWHAKGKEARSIPAWWRVIFCLNDSEESLQVLPPLDDGIKDKILLLKASKYAFPFKGNPSEDEVRAVLLQEMPHFLYWLLNAFVIPESVANSRFGVAGWAHPELAASLREMDRDTQLLALIDEAADAVFVTGAGGVWQGTSTQLHRILLDDGRTASSSRRLLPYPAQMGGLLQRLAASCPTRVFYKKTRDQRTYTILELFADGTVAKMPSDNIEQ
jgi:ABC-type dipeptide/oligopeptide/nickel transport system ATPase component